MKSCGATEKRHSTNNLSASQAKPNHLFFPLLMFWGLERVFSCLDEYFSVGKRAAEALKGNTAKSWWDRWEIRTTIFPSLL